MDSTVSKSLTEATATRQQLARLGRIYAASDRLTERFAGQFGLSCGRCPGECCRQFVPVWPAEAAALRAGLALLDPVVAAQIVDRARAQVGAQRELLAAAGLGKAQGRPLTWSIAAEKQTDLRGLRALPCPLRDESACLAYIYRPLMCRVFGFPARNLPHNTCWTLCAGLRRRPSGTPLPVLAAGALERLAGAITRLAPQPPGRVVFSTVACLLADAGEE